MASPAIDVDFGLLPSGLQSGLSGLGSPFNTPTHKRILSTSSLRNEEGVASLPFSLPSGSTTATATTSTSQRRRTRGYSLLSSTSCVSPRKHIRKVSVEVMPRDEPKSKAAGFGDLPLELVQNIHMLADNPALPQVSTYLRNSLTHASTTYIARYMLYQYRHSSHRSVLTLSLKRPIVTLEVAEEMIRLWDQKRGYVRMSRSPVGSDDSVPSTPSRPRTTAPPLEVTQLPRRLFRPKPLQGEDAIHPLIRWLFSHWDFPLKAQGYYPLARSVINQNYDLVEFLLRRGADPNKKEAFALTAAIEKKDLRMVKLLVEPFEKDASPAGKRRKMADRLTILPAHVQLALSHGTPEIVEYFVHEKGAMPSLGDIMALGSDKKRRRYS